MERKMTTDDMKAYLEYLRNEEKSRATLEKYGRDVRKLYQYLPADKCLSKQALAEFKKSLMKTYKPSSINSMLAAVNGFFNFIQMPECRIRQLRIQKQMVRPAGSDLSREEYTRLLQAARAGGQMRLFYIMQTICSTGIRVSELAFITAESLLCGQVYVNCKNKYRVIWIPDKLCRMLMEYCQEQRIGKGPVFVTRSGRAVHRNNIWAEMKGLCRKAGVDAAKVYPHNLRHLFACAYYRKEKDILKLSDIMGHSNIETTRIYTMSDGEEHIRQINRLGLVISTA